MMAKRRGYTLIEMLLASVVLCGAVLAIGAMSSKPLKAAKLNRQYADAMSIAERQLVLIDYVGVNNLQPDQALTGSIDRGGIGYSWEIDRQYIESAELYSVKVGVNWNAGKRPYNITIETRLSGK